MTNLPLYDGKIACKLIAVVIAGGKATFFSRPSRCRRRKLGQLKKDIFFKELKKSPYIYIYIYTLPLSKFTISKTEIKKYMCLRKNNEMLIRAKFHLRKFRQFSVFERIENFN